MIIRNGKIFTEKGEFREGAVVIEDGKIKEVLLENQLLDISTEEVIDASGMYVIPGFVDIHLHGCVGYDFCDGTKEAFDAITAYELNNGITSISPATMTLAREELTRIFTEVGKYKNVTGSTIRGITMEGPFVSYAKKGAQNGAYIHKPDVAFYEEMQSLCGNLIKQVAVAPEEDEDGTFIKKVSQETVISVAHTIADFDTAKKAFENGASHVTHMFNAMPPFVHRDPSVVGAAFDAKHVFVELICDGVHIHPSMVRAMFALFGSERICMISDSMMATGMEDGAYSLGGQAVNVVGKKATLADGTIAGSASNLYDCLKTVVLEMDVPLESAVIATTLTPAKSLGFDKECGSIEVGKVADIVLLDNALSIRNVIKSGIVVR